MHVHTLKSMLVLATGAPVDVELFSSTGDLLAVVEIPPWEAERLVSLPPCMGHRFEARMGENGRVAVEAVQCCDNLPHRERVE